MRDRERGYHRLTEDEKLDLELELDWIYQGNPQCEDRPPASGDSNPRNDEPDDRNDRQQRKACFVAAAGVTAP